MYDEGFRRTVRQRGTRRLWKRKRHSPEQIVHKLQEADRLLNAAMSLAYVFQSEAIYHRWRNLTPE